MRPDEEELEENEDLMKEYELEIEQEDEQEDVAKLKGELDGIPVGVQNQEFAQNL